MQDEEPSRSQEATEAREDFEALDDLASRRNDPVRLALLPGASS
jgi:hypothetical protein